MSFLFSSGAVDVIPDSGIAQYQFEQDVTDSWNGYDGTPSGGVSYTTDSQQGSYAINLDGSDDTVSVPSQLGDFSTNELTISFYFKAQTLDNYLFRFEGLPAINAGFFSGDLRIEERQNNNQIFYSGITTGTWYFAKITFDGSTYRFYIDGAQEGSMSATDIIDEGAVNNIGSGAGGGNHYDGLIDAFSIYNSVQ